MDKTASQTISPEALAAEFLNEFSRSGKYLRQPIEQLAELAASEDAETVKLATGAIFTSLVERLADSFEARAVLLYNRLFAQLIHGSRKSLQGKLLDKELANFGLLSEEDIIARAERLRHLRRLNLSPQQKHHVKRAIVLSRVTIGADVAVSSVVIERLKQEFPKAEIVLVGGAKTAEIFGGEARVRFAEIHYQRAGTLTERLSSWLAVLGCVRQLLAGLREDEYFIADPDSRLTQLGLLPLVDERRAGATTPDRSNPVTKASIADNYIFFPSRELGGQTNHSLSELTSIWLNAVFGGEEKTLPRLRLKPADKEQAQALVTRMRHTDARPVVAINFGVGENPAKRVSDEFETQLVCRLLAEGARIIFDRGFGRAEHQRADAVLNAARNLSYQGRRINIIEMDEAGLEDFLNEATGAATTNRPDMQGADVVVWQGRIGLLAALIGESDLYIGYDSAGQHIAAALGVPCLDVFAGFSAPRMLERWRPTGRALAQVIAVDTLHQEIDAAAVLSKTLQHAGDLISRKQ